MRGAPEIEGLNGKARARRPVNLQHEFLRTPLKGCNAPDRWVESSGPIWAGEGNLRIG